MIRMLQALRVLSLLAATLIVVSGSLYASVSDRRMKAEEFMPVIGYIERVKGRTGRLPLPDEFEAWKVSRGWENRAVFLETHSLRSSGSCESGRIPQDAYVVVVTHRGLDDCYFSWLTAFSFEGRMVDVWVALAACLLTALALAFAIDRLQTRHARRP